jgi:hypothetical protein
VVRRCGREAGQDVAAKTFLAAWRRWAGFLRPEPRADRPHTIRVAALTWTGPNGPGGLPEGSEITGAIKSIKVKTG